MGCHPSHCLSYFSEGLKPRSQIRSRRHESGDVSMRPVAWMAPGVEKNGKMVVLWDFMGFKDDLTTRITGSLPCSDHNGRPNTIQHVRRWQLGFLQARLQRLTVGTALGLSGVAVTDQRPRAKELGGYVMLAFASLRANRSPSLKGTTKTGSREPPGWHF